MKQRTLALSVVVLASCATYTSQLGYRAQQAAKAQDVEQFKALMDEAAKGGPQFLGDRPIVTVLTHFMGVGGSPQFLPMIEGWKSHGWFGDDVMCTVWRARYEGTHASDPGEAVRVADLCLDRARDAIGSDDELKHLSTCIEDAPFLKHTSTVAMARYIGIAADRTEPRVLRSKMLAGLTKRFMQGPVVRVINETSPDEAHARAATLEQIRTATRTFAAVIAAVRPTTDFGMLAESTAFGALEIERVAVSVGAPWLARWATSRDPYERRLAWSWVQMMKASRKVSRLESLRLWSNNGEPRAPTDWYACRGDSKDELRVVSTATTATADVVKRDFCPRATAIDGPYPLKLTAKAAPASG